MKVNKGEWDRSNGLENDHEFNMAWLAECHRILKPAGTIWVSGTVHVYLSVGMAMLQLGYRILNDIIWQKPNPPPNLGRRCFTHSTETVLWATKAERAVSIGIPSICPHARGERRAADENRLDHTSSQAAGKATREASYTKASVVDRALHQGINQSRRHSFRPVCWLRDHRRSCLGAWPTIPRRGAFQRIRCNVSLPAQTDG